MAIALTSYRVYVRTHGIGLHALEGHHTPHRKDPNAGVGCDSESTTHVNRDTMKRKVLMGLCLLRYIRLTHVIILGDPGISVLDPSQDPVVDKISLHRNPQSPPATRIGDRSLKKKKIYRPPC